MLISLYFIPFSALMTRYFLLTLNCCGKEARSNIDPESYINTFHRVAHMPWPRISFDRVGEQMACKHKSSACKTYELSFLEELTVCVWLTKCKAICDQEYFYCNDYLEWYIKTSVPNILNYCNTIIINMYYNIYKVDQK